MTDKVIRVNVTSSKSQKVTVSSSKVANEITASPDTSAYYSRLAKNWAIAEGLVENIDYSSKHYAQESKASADMAKTYEISTQENYNMFMESSFNANSELQTNRDGALADIEGAKTSAIDSLNSVKDENIASIEAKGDSLTSEITSLSNGYISQINTTGKSYDNLTHRNITNCLTEVPQRIKLELTDGVLTLKAGSVLTVPNGFEEDGTTPKFDEVVVESDVNYKGITTGVTTRHIYYRPSSNTLIAFANHQSGVDGYSGTANCAYYFTNTNVCKVYLSGNLQTYNMSFPIARVTGDANYEVASINQVFNGFGYIGSTIWVDKGVKGLVSNGRNADGTLNNIEARTETVLTYTNTNANQKWFSFATPVNGIWKQVDFIAQSALDRGEWIYNVTDNTWAFKGNIQPWFPFADSTLGSSSPYPITSFKPKQPFRAVDYNDRNLPQVDGQWVKKFYRLLVDGSATGALTPTEGAYSATFDLSSYLPNDGHDYLLTVRIFSLNASTTTALNNFVVNGGYGNMALGKVSGKSVYQDSSIIVPIDKGHKLYVENAPSSGTSTGVNIELWNYRRIGTNN